MADDERDIRETSAKPARKPGNGGVVLPDPPKPFTKENQPAPELKKAGWQQRRAERLLTQMILAKMAEGNTLTEYVESLIKNAKKGNAKAIETVNKGIEDDIIKIEHSGSKVSISIEPDGNTEPI